MKPTIETSDYTLYCGDCLEILPTFADKSVDCVVTDLHLEKGFCIL